MNNFFIALSLAACTLAAGCGKQTSSQESEANDTQDHALANLAETPTTLQCGSTAELPEDFPDDVHLHSNTKILTVVVAPESTMVAFESENSVKTVTEATQTNMLKNGWTATSILDMDGISLCAFSKDGRSATIIITPSNGTTQISLTLTTKTQ